MALFLLDASLLSISILVVGIESASFLHRASCYQVEPGTRVVMLNIAAYEVHRSLVPHTKDHLTRFKSSDHEGLMSWPDQCYKPTQPHEHPIAETNEHANNLSVRAMQLSMYGSMVSQHRFTNFFLVMSINLSICLCLCKLYISLCALVNTT